MHGTIRRRMGIPTNKAVGILRQTDCADEIGALIGGPLGNDGLGQAVGAATVTIGCGRMLVGRGELGIDWRAFIVGDRRVGPETALVFIVGIRLCVSSARIEVHDWQRLIGGSVTEERRKGGGKRCDSTSERRGEATIVKSERQAAIRERESKARRVENRRGGQAGKRIGVVVSRSAGGALSVRRSWRRLRGPVAEEIGSVEAEAAHRTGLTASGSRASVPGAAGRRFCPTS